jgi:hypothetical protein
MRRGAAAVAAAGIGGSVALSLLIGLLGPSAMVPELAGPSWQPPYSLGLRPDAHLVVALAAAAIVLGAAGLAAGLIVVRAATARRAEDGRHGGGVTAGAAVERMLARVPLLVVAGCVVAAVFAFLPPSGSADHLNYAAYGRMVVLGHDPYSTGASDLPGDPIADAVEPPWREEPSVYGPVATAVQSLAALVGGGSVRLTVFALALANSAAFIATAVLLHRSRRHDRVAQLRAALLWTVNPLLLYHLVAGMHVDTLAIACMIAALVTLGDPGRGLPPGGRPAVLPAERPTERPAGLLAGLSAGGRAMRGPASGVLLGLGVAVKLNAGLVALGPAWALRRSPARLILMAGSATATVLVAYALAGGHALDQVRQASRSVSLATPWQLVKVGLQTFVGPGAYTLWIQLGWLALLALLAWSLLRTFPEHPGPVVAAAIVVAYLFAAPYALPWYDGLAFALLALVPATALDGFATARLAVLSLAYLPARVAEQPPDLGWLVTTVRPRVVPAMLLALTVALAVWAWWARARVRRPPA